ncbi:MAG: hypothetical protein BRC58_04190 [Cyanobacteria bacterium QS_8_64_29]|nr:MAG: hypothetical protein BRC58_04190 [Cyanobacteria bacterium QS_8_64_29]
MVTIPDDTYQHLVSCLQAHAPADAGARQVLEELQRAVRPTPRPRKQVSLPPLETPNPAPALVAADAGRRFSKAIACRDSDGSTVELTVSQRRLA